MSAQNCMASENWDKTFELQNTTVMSALLDCQIMNIYCIMKMWWHLEQSHLTLSSCASVSPLSTNAFCSKGCILKDSGRNVSQSRHCLRAGVISDWFLNSGEHTHTQREREGCSILHVPPPPLFFLFHSVSAPLHSKYFCWFTLVHVTALEVAVRRGRGLTSWALSPTSLPDANETGTHV